MVALRNCLLLREDWYPSPPDRKFSWEVIISHPEVSLVAVVGILDERIGEEVKAFVIREPRSQLTAEDLISWSRERLAAYKYPRMVEFRDTLPKRSPRMGT